MVLFILQGGQHGQQLYTFISLSSHKQTHAYTQGQDCTVTAVFRVWEPTSLMRRIEGFVRQFWRILYHCFISNFYWYCYVKSMHFKKLYVQSKAHKGSDDQKAAW